MKKYIIFTINLLLIASLLLIGCSSTSKSSDANSEKSIPTIYLSYFQNDHQVPLFTAFEKGEEFKDLGVYFETIIEKEKYKLISNGEEMAIVEVIVSKSGAEATTMFAQGNLDIGLFSITAAMSGIDTGVPIKVLAPVHTDGPGLVMNKDINISGWDEFLAYVKEQKEPVKIGYHSPTSSPKIVFEGALERAGISFTKDYNELDAEILLVDLKSASNFTPALLSGEVDGWVGPSPHPQVAEVQGTGNFVMQHRDLPPDGYWHGFPCCVVVASEEMIADKKEILSAILTAINNGAKHVVENKEVGARVASNWLGVPYEAAILSNVVYTTDPSEAFIRGAGIHLEVLNGIGNFSDKLKDKEIKDVMDIVFDFSIIKEVLNNN